MAENWEFSSSINCKTRNVYQVIIVIRYLTLLALFWRGMYKKSNTTCNLIRHVSIAETVDILLIA